MVVDTRKVLTVIGYSQDAVLNGLATYYGMLRTYSILLLLSYIRFPFLTFLTCRGVLCSQEALPTSIKLIATWEVVGTPKQLEMP